MDQASIIHDLLSWLDSHLDSHLSVDHVAAKSGYSKWHLQRMFKEITGQAVGSYIRKRRLSKAAIGLRLTSRPILEIALQYHFDSQQTFTRAFKKQFNQTPAYYRRSENWNTFGICPPIVLTEQCVDEPELLVLPAKKLVGITQAYTCSLEQLPVSLSALRNQFWKAYLSHVKPLPSILYGLHHVQASQEKDDEQQVFYTTAIEVEQVTDGINGKPIEFNGGRYAKFSYCGLISGLHHFIITLYSTRLPRMSLVRRKGYDIEIFYPNNWCKKNPSQTILCDYFIPITDLND